MNTGRFSLLLLGPEEIYFEDFGATLITSETTVETVDFKKSEGRLKLCSKSLIFEPKQLSKPLIKIPFKDCTIIEKWKGSIHFVQGENVIRIVTKVYIEMLEMNIIAPYKFCENGHFIISLMYTKLLTCLDNIYQLQRASTLPANEQADMIATIAYSRYARIAFDPHWLDLYEKIIFETTANKISPMVVNPGRVVLSTSTLYFQPFNNVEVSPVLKIKLNSIQRIFKRRFLLRHTGLEIYYKCVEMRDLHIYLMLRKNTERDELYNLLMQHPQLKLSNDQEVMTLKWQHRTISNYEYLLYINNLADRSKNDLTQYPVFPWIIFDYKSEELDLNDESIYRDLSKPMGALNETRLQRLMERYEEMPEPKFIYGSHYSTPGFIVFYLVRKYPHYMLCLQNGRFDQPDRMFNSCADLCKNSLNDMSDFKELIPEFYDTEEGGSFLVNSLGINFGNRQDGIKVNDVQLPPWAKSPNDFVRKLRDALESDYVSQRLHNWIDLIFGYKQTGEEAVKAKNVYYHLCYEGSVDLDSVTDFNDRQRLQVQIKEFGQIPKQVFHCPHPKRKSAITLIIDPSQIKEENKEYDIWRDLPNLNHLMTFYTHQDKVSCVLVTEDCERVISVGYDSKMKVFSINQKKQIRSANIGNVPLGCCLKLPNLNILLIGKGNEIIVYDIDFGCIKENVNGHGDAIKCLNWSPELNVLCSGSDDCLVCIWQFLKEDGNIKPMPYLLHQFEHKSLVTCTVFDKVNEHLYVGTDDGKIYIWKLSDYSLQKKIKTHQGKITGISFSPDGQKMISCSYDNTFLVSDTSTGMTLYEKNFGCSLTCLKWEEFLILIGTENGDLLIWDVIKVELIYQKRIHSGAILSVDISKDKKYVVTGGADNLITVWSPL